MYVSGKQQHSECAFTMPGPGSDPISVLATLVAELSREKDEPHRLLAAFGRGELTSNQIIDELTARFQLGIGASMQALAEYDKDAAQQLGTRLKGRLDTALAEIGKRSGAKNSASQATKFSDKDDDVLRREYAIAVKLLTHNGAVKTADLIAVSRTLEPDISDEAVTAHLNRIVLAGAIVKGGKGRYLSGPETKTHRDNIKEEIEMRHLDIPSVS